MKLPVFIPTAWIHFDFSEYSDYSDYSEYSDYSDFSV